MFIQVLLPIFIGIWLFMTSFFVIAYIKKNNGLVDIAWGIGFALIAWYTFLYSHTFYARQILVTSLITLWAARLSGYLFMRNWNKKEDIRYVEMKKPWGKWTGLYSYIFVFLLQGALIILISTPI